MTIRQRRLRVTRMAPTPQPAQAIFEIAEVSQSHGAAPREDLVELWTRIVFNVMVSNTYDHLRNHVLLMPTGGWRLSNAYDMNPVPGSTVLCLNIDESDNALNLRLVRSVARYFHIRDAQAVSIIDRMSDVVRDSSGGVRLLQPDEASNRSPLLS